jgi:hypothetical protein
MLKRLEAEGGKQNRTIAGIWGSHPITENRVARVREMIDDIEAGRDISEDREDRDDREGRRRRRR